MRSRTWFSVGGPNPEKMAPACILPLCRLHTERTMVPKPPAPAPKALSSVLPRRLPGPSLQNQSLRQGTGECSPVSKSVCRLHRRVTQSLVALRPTEWGKESPHWFLLPAIMELPFPAEELWAGKPGCGVGGSLPQQRKPLPLRCPSWGLPSPHGTGFSLLHVSDPPTSLDMPLL